MPILTPRLRLQPRHAGEGAVINRAIRESLAHLAPWMPFAKTEPTVDETETHCRVSQARYILREDFTLSIYDRATSEFVGSTGLHQPNWSVPSFHLGYWLCEKFQGRGLIAESTNALTRYAFAVLGAKRVEIRCDFQNRRSFAVMQRLGYGQEGVLRGDEVGVDGELRDTIVTARANAEGLPPLEVSWGG